MNDLRSQLELLGGPVTPPSADTVTADITRGHAALRRRTTVRAAGATLGIAAVAAATALAVTSLSVTAPVDSIAGRASDRPPAGVQHADGPMRLVAYVGDQPADFTIDVVPEGFFIQSQTDYHLVLAPARAQNPGPEVNPSADWIYDPNVLSGKIAVYLQHEGWLIGQEGYEEITVGGKPGAFRDMGRGAQIFVAVAPTVYLTIQFDSDPELTKEQMIEVAAGVHGAPEAIARLAADS